MSRTSASKHGRTRSLADLPRLLRGETLGVALDRAETTVVASVGLAFGFAWLARYFDYSAALGAFLAGALVAGQRRPARQRGAQGRRGGQPLTGD